MSRRDLHDSPELLRRYRLGNPARRRAILGARDALLAAVAAPGLPALGAAPAAPPLRVMHGFADHTTISLWLQGAGAQSLRVDVTPEVAGAPPRSFAFELGARNDFTGTLEVGGLEPGTRYEYAIRAEKRAAVLARGSFRTQVYWQHRTDPPTVRIATGSCAYLNDGRFDRPGKPYGGGEEVFDSIAATQPDLMLWLGDNIYLRESEWTSRDGINRRYRNSRNHPRLEKLWTAAPHVAIWDDHDFGPDNGDNSYSGLGWTTEAFLRYWPLPFAPRADGLYGSIQQGDVDIFLLDDRTHRYPKNWPEGADKVVYGPKQMQWLKAALTASQAPFKLVAGGGQFLNRIRVTPSIETWALYPAERDDFLRFLEERRIPGVIFLSGDRHFSAHVRLQRQGLYPLNDVTVSPFTSGPSSGFTEAERNNPDLVPGSIYNDRNFGFITVTGPRSRRALAIELRDTRGNRIYEWNTTAAELAMGTRNA
jgi:alkaline phosphatase D